MEYCFVSRQPILDIPGQVDVFQPYLLGPGDDALQEAVGPCYILHLAASPYAALWGPKVLQHLTGTIGLRSLGQVGDHQVLFNPRSKVVTVLLPSGATFDLPRQVVLSKAKRQDGWAWIECTIEYNLHDLAPAVASEIQQALVAEGAYALSRLAEHLGVSDCFRQPAVLAHARLVFDKSLKRYWDAHSSSSNCTYVLLVPEGVLDLALAAV
jgi:hypothetical protein